MVQSRTVAAHRCAGVRWYAGAPLALPPPLYGRAGAAGIRDLAATISGHPPVVSPPITCSTVPVMYDESAFEARKT